MELMRPDIRTDRRPPARLWRCGGAAAAGLAVCAGIAGCALPPPPGALFEWSDVRPITIPPDRPMRPVDVTWEALVEGTALEAPNCGADACHADADAWFDRCAQPRVDHFARIAMARLQAGGNWHPQGFAMLATSMPAVASGPGACAPRRLAARVAAGVVLALAVEAERSQRQICTTATGASLDLAVLELDRERQSFGDFVVHDMPSIFGSTLGAIFSLGTVTAMSDLVHRVVDLDLTLQRDGMPPTLLRGRGAAGIAVGSLKMAERTTAPPPELVRVAFIEALRALDGTLARQAERDCRPVAD